MLKVVRRCAPKWTPEPVELSSELAPDTDRTDRSRRSGPIAPGPSNWASKDRWWTSSALTYPVLSAARHLETEAAHSAYP
ncbi:hypothetical protein GCM10010383_78350 [Streptomyces lomondensis]|uniref:Uncharacterized protein n=1 Tax=Streptomyces lomondensis TaxID=68229 RepID=A0ABQ2XVT9_9ACTN|nr:hypothetical protein GCM10010383_78350 [Streptomyces lomondensis]